MKRILKGICFFILLCLTATILMPTNIFAIFVSEHEDVESTAEADVALMDGDVSPEIYTYEIRPLLENDTYNLGDNIPIVISVQADSAIRSFECTYEGFQENTVFAIVNSSIVGSIICNSTPEEAQFNISVTLENDACIEASVYGFISNGTVYINVNSMFGARDVYWARMLNEGIFTKLEYEAYLAEIIPTTTQIQSTQISSGSISDTNAVDLDPIVVSGTLDWEDDWGNSHPLQHTKVKIIRKYSSPLLDHIEWVLGTTYTDSDGYYSATVEIPGASNICLKIYPEGKNTVVQTGAGNEYVWSTDITTGVTSDVSINGTIKMDQDIGKAFQISQAVISASVFAAAVYDGDIDPVTVKYPHGINEKGCFYRSSEKTIYIVGDRNNDGLMVDGVVLRSYASWDVIQHEFFHHIQYQAGIIASPGGWHVVDMNMYTHFMSHINGEGNDLCNGTCANPTEENAKDCAIKLAYAEAVPSVLGCMSQDYLINEIGCLDNNIRTVGDAQYTAYNYAIIYYETTASRDGEANESTVCAILWDIFDDTVEEGDTISMSYQDFWDALVTNQNKTLSEFVTTLYSISAVYKYSLGSILEYRKVAPEFFAVSGKSMYGTPYFSWIANGSNDENSYSNNSFTVHFCDPYKNELFSITTSDNNYRMTESQWNQILSYPSDYFYWCVSATQNDGYGNITGPYYSDYWKVDQPLCQTVTIDKSARGGFILQSNFIWFKFIVPTSGTYKIYTEGSIDTYGELFEYPVCNLETTNRYRFDDNSGDYPNFQITYEFDYQQTVYIRVRNINNALGEFTLHADLVGHVHHYNVSYTCNDLNTHRALCDCGAYEDVAHEWEGIGPETIRCIYCLKRFVGAIPGGMISSVGGGETTDTTNPATMPVEVITKEEE